MSRDWCAAFVGGIRLAVHIAPNAKKTEIIGVHDAMLKIRLQAQPIEGRANEVLIRFVAKLLGVPRSTVCLAQGHASRRKVLEIASTGLRIEAVRQTLEDAAIGK